MFAQKTTWAGIGSIVTAVGYGIVTKNYAAAGMALFSGFGLIFAGDAAKA